MVFMEPFLAKQLYFVHKDSDWQLSNLDQHNIQRFWNILFIMLYHLEGACDLVHLYNSTDSRYSFTLGMAEQRV